MAQPRCLPFPRYFNFNITILFSLLLLLLWLLYLTRYPQTQGDTPHRPTSKGNFGAETGGGASRPLTSQSHGGAGSRAQTPGDVRGGNGQEADGGGEVNSLLLSSPLAAVGEGASSLRSALKSAGGEVSPIKEGVGGEGGRERRGTAASRPETGGLAVSGGRLGGGILRVRILNLYNNGIADAGAIVLAKALGKFSSITSLSLRSNHVSDYGLQAIALAVRHSDSIRHMDLSFNEIGDAGAQGLGEALGAPPAARKKMVGGGRVSRPRTSEGDGAGGATLSRPGSRDGGGGGGGLLPDLTRPRSSRSAAGSQGGGSEGRGSGSRGGGEGRSSLTSAGGKRQGSTAERPPSQPSAGQEQRLRGSSNNSLTSIDLDKNQVSDEATISPKSST